MLRASRLVDVFLHLSFHFASLWNYWSVALIYRAHVVRVQQYFYETLAYTTAYYRDTRCAEKNKI